MVTPRDIALIFLSWSACCRHGSFDFDWSARLWVYRLRKLVRLYWPLAFLT
jgi:hypothetical protein